MKKLGNACEIITVEGGPHGVENWEKDPRFQTYKKPMVDWLKRILAGR